MAPDTRQIINRLINMHSAELQEVAKAIDKINANRVNQRRKELWGNVVAALRKYTEEVGDIKAEGSFGEGIICVDDLDNPGIVYIAE